MSIKANLSIFIISCLFLAALISRNNAIALLALPFMFFLGAGFISSREEVNLRVKRTVSCKRGKADQVITMRVKIWNEGSTLVHLHILEQTPKKILVLEGDLEYQVALPANETCEFVYTFKASRGRYDWQTIRIDVSDPFGLFVNKLEPPAEASVLILPEEYELYKLPFFPMNTLHTPGSILSRLPGIGTDFWGVREYHPGDSIRWIDWRQSARHPQTLITKEFEREEIADIALLLDARAATNITHGNENLFEYAVRAVAALAKYYIRTGNRVSLLVLGERLIRVFPGSGRQQMVRIMDRLAGCELAQNTNLDNLKYLPVKLFPRDAMVIMVSPLRLNDIEAIARLHTHGYQVVVVSPDPVYFSVRDIRSPLQSLAMRPARLERMGLLWKIRQLGIETINWQIDDSLLKTILSQSTRGR